MYQSYKERGLKVFAVGVDWDGPYNCEEWGETFGLSYPALDDSDQTISTRLSSGHPWHTILDHDMVVRYSAYGWNETLIAATIEDVLTAMPTINVEEGQDNPSLILPSEITLYNAYPNPFNATTTVRYDLPHNSDIAIDVFDVSGKHIETLERTPDKKAGHHEISWYAGSESSGIYIFRFQSSGTILTKKVMLAK